jgi:hypothetical protein
MVVKRTFVTKLEPVDAFGLANELLRPRGFRLDKGTPPRSQQWRRGVEAGTNARSVFQANQTIDVEFDRGRVNVTATADISGRKAVHAQNMLTSYAEALERLMASGESPAVAGKLPRRTEGAIRRAVLGRTLSVCVIVLAVLGGAGYAVTSMPNFPSPLKWFSSAKGGLADGKKKSGSPPVVIVRRAGAQSNAAKSSDQSP